jgi:Protein of unknown function (DUF1549)
VLPGKPDESRLLRALRYIDPKLQMPPTGKLPDETIASFAEWIASGAVDPRVDSTGTAQGPAAIDLEQGRKWWAFQPVREVTPPGVRATSWPRTRIDAFILARLEEKNLKPSAPADARTLVRRAWVDLVG